MLRGSREGTTIPASSALAGSTLLKELMHDHCLYWAIFQPPFVNQRTYPWNF